MQSSNEEFSIRSAQPQDKRAIESLLRRAFADVPYSNQNEHELVAALQSAGKMALEIVAESGGDIVGYLSFTRAQMDGLGGEIYCLAPLAVDPGRHRSGIGSALTEAGLNLLRSDGAAACVVYGDPAYYGRFGFGLNPDVTSPGLEQQYFQVLFFGSKQTQGSVTLDPLFAEFE